jgi:hypothetical protein
VDPQARVSAVDSPLAAWRTNESRAQAYAQLQSEAVGFAGAHDAPPPAAGLEVAASPKGGLEARWERAQQELATKQAESDAKGVPRREAALRRAAARQQAGLYPWAQTPGDGAAEATSRKQQPKQQRGQRSDGAQRDNGDRSGGGGRSNNSAFREGEAGAVEEEEVLPVDMNDVLPRRFGPAVAERFRTAPAGQDRGAAAELQALKLAIAHALLLGDLSPSPFLKDDAAAATGSPAGFTEADLFAAAGVPEVAEPPDSLALAAAIPMEALLAFMDAHFTVSAARNKQR